MTTVVRLLPRAFMFMPRAVAAGPVHWRRRLIALGLAAAALMAAYLLWFRDSSLVSVERVDVVGLSAAPDAARLRSNLTTVAKQMTTLNVDQDRLRALVANDPAVHAIEVRPNFPHGLTIDVTENRPVAVLVVGGHNLPVAADGTLLPGVDTGVTLPSIRTVATPSGHRLGSGAALDRVEVASAAPRPLLEKIGSISIQPGRGFVAQLNNGPAIWLGGFARLEDKWAAATAVLAQRSSQGAAYIDVRMPERPVAGGLAIASTGQATPEAAAAGGIPGSPGVLHADPGQSSAGGQAPTATAPTQTSTAPLPTAPQNTRP